MALIETLNEAFTSNTMNASLWGLSVGPGTTVQTGGQLVITPPSNTVAATYDGYLSVNTYDLTASRVTLEVVQGLTATTGAEQVLSLYFNASNNMSMFYTNNNLALRLRTGGSSSDTFVSRSDVNMRWWRIREVNGFILWETSPTGAIWTIRRTAAVTFAITALSVRITAGTWQNVATPGTAIFDNVNMLNTTPMSWLGM